MAKKKQETEKIELPPGGARGMWAEVLKLGKRVEELHTKKPADTKPDPQVLKTIQRIEKLEDKLSKLIEDMKKKPDQKGI